MIVHTVIDDSCAGWYERGWGEHELIDPDGPAADDVTGEAEPQLTLERFVGTPAPGDGEVARLWLLERLDPDQIAARPGRHPNAVDEATLRVVRRLRESPQA